MAEQTAPADLAVTYIRAFARGDQEVLRRLLAADVVFESPRVKLAGADEVLKAMVEFSQAVTGVDIIAVFGDDQQALIMYDMHTGPFGTLRTVDHLLVRGGRITSDVIVFDTGPLGDGAAASG